MQFKHSLLVFIICVCHSLVFSQTEGTIIVVTNADAEIFIDGDNLGKVAANEAKKVISTDGEHFIQAKSNGVAIDETVVFEAGKQKVVKLKFETVENKAEEIKNSAIYVADMKLYLPGGLTSEASWDVEYYAFDAGDEAIIDMKILDEKGNGNLEIKSYPNGGLIFSEKDFRQMTQKRVRFPEKGIYKFYFYTDHVFDRTASIKIQRIPANTSSPTFSTSVKMKRDTIYHDVLNSNIKVYGANDKQFTNRTSIKINLPDNTIYWVYWIGVGEEANEQIESLKSALNKNPIAAYGLRSIPSLPQSNSSATINYRFLDNQNTQSFKANIGYNYMAFKQGNNVSMDYSLVKTMPKDLNIGFWNLANVTRNVIVKVGAFSIQKRYYMKQ